jgi:methylenetetrahydrofolate reductase (NADPH)
MRATFSVEVFPPKDVRGAFALRDCVAGVAELAPAWLSVTYGAGGSERVRTAETVAAVAEAQGAPVLAHLTAVGQSRDEVLAAAASFREAGARGIVALRGDAPEGEAFAPHPEGFAGSVELVTALRGAGWDRVAVSAYPERHPDAPYNGADVEHLLRKEGAGATEAVTQFFFRPETFLRFRDACDRAGLRIPVHPGVLPVRSWDSARKLAGKCGASVPPTVATAFENAQRDGTTRLLAVATATALCDRLVAEGAQHFHLYALNRAGWCATW